MGDKSCGVNCAFQPAINQGSDAWNFFFYQKSQWFFSLVCLTWFLFWNPVIIEGVIGGGTLSLMKVVVCSRFKNPHTRTFQ